MKSALLLLVVAHGAAALVCDQNSLCDNVMTCTAGLFCGQPDALGIGRCCLDTDATTPGFVTQFPIFGTTRFSGACNPYKLMLIEDTQFPNNMFNTVSPFNPGAQSYPGACQDLPNPATGVSDCHLRANLCFDSNYYEVMTRQCPQTCGRCGASQYGGSSTLSIYGSTLYPGSGGCIDRVNPATGQSDCARRANLCFDQLYQNLMKVQCPKTCGLCTGSGITSGIGFGLTSTPGYNLFTQTRSISGIGGNCVDTVNPRTGTSDCGNLAYLCKRSDYASLMRVSCPRTCNFC